MKTAFRMKNFVICTTLALGTAAVLLGSPMLEHYQKHLKTAGDFTVAVAEQMPESDYGFKLTPAQMSFSQQIAHIANANMYFFSVLAGEKPADAKPASQNKADVIAFLKQSNEYCQKVLAHVTADQLAKSYKTEDGEMTGTELIMLSFDHTTHHRAQAEMYLRAKGIKPTDYKF
jgi:uncharacterized damage-inducible protein DinB